MGNGKSIEYVLMTFPYQPEQLHFLVVHYPLALLTTGWFFDILGSSIRKDSLHHAGWWCLVFGVISLVFTIITGFLADTVTGHMSDPFPVFQTHGSVQILCSILFTALFIWRSIRRSHLPGKPMLYLYFFVGGIAVILLVYGGHLGAKLSGMI